MMKKFLSSKLGTYIRFYANKLKKMFIILVCYYFTLFFAKIPFVELVIPLIQIILVLLLFYYATTFIFGSIYDFFREFRHGGKYMSAFPDKKEILLTEIYREMIESKERIKANQEKNTEYVYMGELKAEDIKK